MVFTWGNRKVSFVLEPLVISSDRELTRNFPVRSRPEENFPKWKPALSISKTLFNHANLIQLNAGFQEGRGTLTKLQKKMEYYKIT